jgi:aromatic ring-opening dioxygenase catalytic subunit (LigB family)
MTIAFACATSHAPGITAWPEAATPAQRDAIYAGFERLQRELAAAAPEALIVFTSEHWTNYFLDHISAFCIGKAAQYMGPTEPWLKIARGTVSGDPELAGQLIDFCYSQDIDPAYASEMNFDHGTWLPLHFLTPRMDVPVIPIMINTLASPQPSARRCFALGQAVGQFARASKKRIGLVATGGMSHDPGELRHGWIDREFDQRFLEQMRDAEFDRLVSYRATDFAAEGAGAFELLAWVALAGALQSYRAEVIAYEAVERWATGIGLMSFAPHAP